MTTANTVDTAAINARVDIRQLAGSVTQLRRASASELEGPCPRCGGEDRLHVRHDGWFCRHCAPINEHGWHDAIDWMKWLHNVSFQEAVRMLDSTAMLPTTKNIAPVQHKPGQTRPPADWWAHEPANMARYTAALWAAPNPVYDYLLGRGFTDDTLRTYRIGYAANAMRRGPAVAIPWFRGSELFGIHFRFLDGQEPKLKYELDSRPRGLLWGKYAFRPNGKYLVLVEGELNAMSVAQVMQAQAVDVLSMGGQDSTITPAAAAFAQTYPVRVVWMDEEDRAKKRALQLNAGAFWSTTNGAKRDANDYLQRAELAGLLASLLSRCGADARDF